MTTVTPDAFDAVCDAIAEGKSLRAICAEDGMPSRQAVLRYIDANEAAADQYARARDEQADHYADEIIGIADTEEDAQKARVRIDARKWVASKLKPKRYGDRQQHDVNATFSVTLESDATRL